MNQGALLFAYNTPETDYLKMASITASRIKRFLDFPSTVVTNEESIKKTNTDMSVFDRVITVDSTEENYISRKLWLNKGRHQAYELSPYEDTLLLDVDYVVNSKQLLKLFELDNDIQLHDTIRYLTTSQTYEQIGTSKFNTLWATVVRFKKTNRAKQLFGMLKMIQENYNYYTNMYHYYDFSYRNDYAITIALKTINGQLYRNEDFIKWELLHVPEYINVVKLDDTTYNMERTDKVTHKTEYIKVKDLDFHVLNKKNFLEMFNA
jgi:hypothetical protein